MTVDWEKIKQQTDTLRAHLTKLSGTTEIKSACYVISREEIEKLLDQKGDKSKLDGLRIYVGGEMDKDGNLMPIIHILACEKDTNGVFNDYNIPGKIPEKGSEDFLKLPLLAAKYPCSPHCGTSNFLNSDEASTEI